MTMLFSARRPFRSWIFWIAFAICCVLAFIGHIGAGAEDEGTLGPGSAWRYAVWLFHVMRFPTHTLFWPLFSATGWLWLAGLLLNCAFYAVVIERILALLRSPRERSAEQ